MTEDSGMPVADFPVKEAEALAADGEAGDTLCLDDLSCLGEEEGDDFVEDDVYDCGDEEEEDRLDSRQELQKRYDQLLEFNEAAMRTNVALQRRVIQRNSQGKSSDVSEKHSESKVTEHKYLTILNNVRILCFKLRLQEVKTARASEVLKNKLEAKRQKGY